jgi:glucuronate isomerase
VIDAFLHDDILLTSATARRLYHEVAASLPIVDVHTHLCAQDVADDKVYDSLAHLWLEDDHYKWRAMRMAGVDEQLITGDADPWDRFVAWARTVPRLVGNPLYLWTHLELRRVFGIDLPLSDATAGEIWEEANRQLPQWSARTLLAHFSVSTLATTDDPAHDLRAHREIAARTGDGTCPVVPTWRPDDAHRLLDDPPAWNAWADRLAGQVGVAIGDLASLADALRRSYQSFAEAGCRASDHGLDFVPDAPRDVARADAAVRRVRDGKKVDAAGRLAVTSEVLDLAARLAHARSGVVQLHLGALRDVSPRLQASVGRDAGGDAVGDQRQAPGLARFLGGLEAERSLPRVVLYNANPADNMLFATLAGAFSLPGVTAAVQWGPPWWFNDHPSGIRRQLEELAQVGQLAGFMGMVADSRSLLSMTRHEVFRRILCDGVGREVEAGLIPSDMGWLGELVRGICVDNAARLFGLSSTPSVQWT